LPSLASTAQYGDPIWEVNGGWEILAGKLSFLCPDLLDSDISVAKILFENGIADMPLYEYECQNCKKTFEIIQKFSDPALTACPTCGNPVQKLMSRTSFQLKGGGWYATDYKKAGTSDGGGKSEN
jgi:putative FmdB family regulatory protein